ncbi:hypothetical protein Y1Q_0019876 [Alligator mississippiensis]|uniref:Uncharacterized protein n=1 Tax=Alligator mississippiensis TaxID=8496 RepID=A0A151PFQ5_ALLMI|nr:hypothetical protein Y1Q_0019876 [Alligator mississippiensis]
MTALETEIDCLFTGKFTAWPAAAEASLHWGPIMTTLCVGLQLISGDHAKVYHSCTVVEQLTGRVMANDWNFPN